MENIKEENENDFDKCVRCGKPSPYPIDYSIENRNCNMHDAEQHDIGQLCIDCFRELYNRSN